MPTPQQEPSPHQDSDKPFDDVGRKIGMVHDLLRRVWDWCLRSWMVVVLVPWINGAPWLALWYRSQKTKYLVRGLIYSVPAVLGVLTAHPGKDGRSEPSGFAIFLAILSYAFGIYRFSTERTEIADLLGTLAEKPDMRNQGAEHRSAAGANLPVGEQCGVGSGIAPVSAQRLPSLCSLVDFDIPPERSSCFAAECQAKIDEALRMNREIQEIRDGIEELQAKAKETVEKITAFATDVHKKGIQQAASHVHRDGLKSAAKEMAMVSLFSAAMHAVAKGVDLYKKAQLEEQLKEEEKKWRAKRRKLAREKLPRIQEIVARLEEHHRSFAAICRKDAGTILDSVERDRRVAMVASVRDAFAAYCECGLTLESSRLISEEFSGWLERDFRESERVLDLESLRKEAATSFLNWCGLPEDFGGKRLSQILPVGAAILTSDASMYSLVANEPAVAGLVKVAASERREALASICREDAPRILGQVPADQRMAAVDALLQTFRRYCECEAVMSQGRLVGAEGRVSISSDCLRAKVSELVIWSNIPSDLKGKSLPEVLSVGAFCLISERGYYAHATGHLSALVWHGVLEALKKTPGMLLSKGTDSYSAFYSSVVKRLPAIRTAYQLVCAGVVGVGCAAIAIPSLILLAVVGAILRHR